MKDILTQLYYFDDGFLPVAHNPDDAQRALEASLTPEPEALWEAYQRESFDRDERERRILFAFLVKLGLHIP